MRKKFLGYYKPTQNELTKMWKEAIFVFDTSVLLNIYRYTPETREDFFKILEQLKSRIWIPHQVAYEYLEQRENVIAQQNLIYEDIKGILSYLQKNVINKYKKGHPFADTSKIQGIFEEAVEKAQDVLHSAQAEHPDLLAEDLHLDRLTRLLKDDQIGEEFPKERVHKIYAEGELRYKEKIPPGYADKNDKDGLNKYGDILLWFQLIEHAKSQNKPIIFIIDDQKEDWWRINKEGIILGPKPELIQEMYDKTKATFYMYLADEFIKRAQEFLNVEVQQSTIDEVRGLREREKLDQDDKGVAKEWIDYIVRKTWERGRANELIPRLFFNVYDTNLVERDKLNRGIRYDYVLRDPEHPEIRYYLEIKQVTERSKKE